LPIAATTYSGRIASPFAVTFGRQVAVEDYLGNPCPVAHIEKDQIPVIPAPVHPAHQYNLLTCVRRAQLAAHMRPFQLSNKIEHFRCPLLVAEGQ
jgi:hypothetical protein